MEHIREGFIPKRNLPNKWEIFGFEILYIVIEFVLFLLSKFLILRMDIFDLDFGLEIIWTIGSNTDKPWGNLSKICCYIIGNIHWLTTYLYLLTVSPISSAFSTSVFIFLLKFLKILRFIFLIMVVHICTLPYILHLAVLINKPFTINFKMIAL